MLLKTDFFLYLISLGLLSCIPPLYAMNFVSCYEWNNKSYVFLDCGVEILKINSVKHGLSQKTTFCQSLEVDPDNDCFDTYNVTEVDVFRGCNMENKCNVSIPFLSLKKTCDTGDSGSKYVMVNYDCVSGATPVIDMNSYDSSNANHMSSQTLYLTSYNYPSFVKDTNICEVTLADNSLLKISVMELHQKRIHSLSCAFSLVISDKTFYSSKCTEVIWEAPTSDSNLEFVAQNSDLRVQIALHTDTPNNGGEGKVWLQLQTYDGSNKNEMKSGFVSLECGPHIALWTTTSSPSSNPTDSLSSPVTGTVSMVSSSPTTTTTTFTSPPSSNPTDSFSSPVTGTVSMVSLSSQKPDVVNRSTVITTTSSSPDASPRKLKENSLMPIIAGVVAGGLVFFVIVIIIIILMVRKHQLNHKPPKQLDVIDAWDNQSVIDAAKKTAQDFKLEEPYDMSSSLSPSYPQKGRGSFHHQISSYSNSSQNDYAEVPSLPGSKAPSEIGVSNKGYERDSYYTGDIESDLYLQVNKHDNRSLRKKNGSVMIESPPRVSQLYAKPIKKKKSTSGFDDPGWAQNGCQEYESDTDVEGNDVKGNEAIYGYTTTLE